MKFIKHLTFSMPYRKIHCNKFRGNVKITGIDNYWQFTQILTLSSLYNPLISHILISNFVPLLINNPAQSNPGFMSEVWILTYNFHLILDHETLKGNLKSNIDLFIC